MNHRGASRALARFVDMNEEHKPLNIATLRATGSEADLNELVAKLALRVSSRVCAGDRRRKGGVFAEPHLNADIADAANPEAMMEQLRAFFRECLRHGPELFRGVNAELAVGMSVGDTVQFVASTVLEPADIRDLAAIGIAFSVAAYPTSDGA